MFKVGARPVVFAVKINEGHIIKVVHCFKKRAVYPFINVGDLLHIIPIYLHKAERFQLIEQLSL